MDMGHTGWARTPLCHVRDAAKHTEERWRKRCSPWGGGRAPREGAPESPAGAGEERGDPENSTRFSKSRESGGVWHLGLTGDKNELLSTQ